MHNASGPEYPVGKREITTVDLSQPPQDMPVDAAMAGELSFSRSENYCVCVVDIVNSTKAVAEITDPTRVRRYYCLFINSISSIAKKFRGKVIKNMGDAVAFYFPDTKNTGFSRPFKDVINCGARIIDTRDLISQMLVEEKLPSIRYRISADFGKLEIADGGASGSEDFFGSTMNVVSKINKIATPNSMVIGGDLYQIINRFNFSEYTFRATQGYSLGFRQTYPVYALGLNGFASNGIEDGHPSKNPASVVRNSSRNEVRPDIVSAVGLAGVKPAPSIPFVMLIDDERESMSTIRQIVESAGLRVDAFADPLKAIKHFVMMGSQHYAAVIIDIGLPVLNGLQVFQRLKTLSPEIKTIFLSDYHVPSEFLGFLPGVGHEDVIVRPITEDTFVPVLLNKIRTHRNALVLSNNRLLPVSSNN
ncbi:MAG: response regulator [Nitrososphaera sp.]